MKKTTEKINESQRNLLLSFLIAESKRKMINHSRTGGRLDDKFCVAALKIENPDAVIRTLQAEGVPVTKNSQGCYKLVY